MLTARKGFYVLMAFLLFSPFVLRVQASSTLTNYGIPYQTYTLGASNNLIPTQTAYIPVGVFGRDLNLQAPRDIHYKDGLLYIADTGNRRIVVTDRTGVYQTDYALDVFQAPTGIFVKDNYLFVADRTARAVFMIDRDTSEIVQTITKPTSPIYGQHNDFVPTKVVVDNSYNLYIVGEGSTSGIIQINYAGEFMGYLGINPVDLSLRRILFNFFVQNPDFARSLPASPTNVALGSKGAILTTNANVRESFKRLNISGINTLSPSTFYPTATLADIWMNHEDYIYLITEAGGVYEFDAQGQLLFHFNTRDATMTQTLGLTSSPSAIVSDEDGTLYILDRGYHAVHLYQRTVFVDLVHEAVTLYNDGRYLESKPLFEEILRQNSSFALASSALGSALAKEGNYREALEAFHDANDYHGYSQTFWEIRNEAIQDYLVLFSGVVAFSFIGVKTALWGFKRSRWRDKFLAFKAKLGEKKLVAELTYGLHVFKRPDDMIFGIKRLHKTSYLSATLFFMMFIMVYLINMYATGFLFRNADLSGVILQVSLVTGLFLLYVLVNYLVSTLLDGEGRFKDIFIASCYVLIPFILLTPPMTLVSNVLTYNEQFIYDFYNLIVVGWTLFLLVFSIKSVHNYKFWETFKTLLIIVFGMFILILIGLLVYSFIGQLLEFIASIIREVVYRV
ncbi:MAG: hypothetical protein EA374_03435 [Acholeplasmatales bacterium]|nr:MAG: hypothetical protein EA374_03435 [Acholeplasmatales bacterium]